MNSVFSIKFSLSLSLNHQLSTINHFYTLTLDPDVALLGLSFPNEQDAAFRAFEEFRPLGKEQLKEIENRAVQAIEGKGRCWWNPEKGEGKKRGRLGIQIVEEP